MKLKKVHWRIVATSVHILHFLEIVIMLKVTSEKFCDQLSKGKKIKEVTSKAFVVTISYFIYYMVLITIRQRIFS